MNRFSKFIAVAMAATMVVASSFTAFAEDTNTGNSVGGGTPEGHVKKKAMSVVLPTIAEGSTPFAYTMDPEGLIKETTAARYPNTIFPEAASDSQVYFNNGPKGGEGDDKDYTVYANSSASQKVTNKSSHAISLTVKAEVSSPATTDIPLVGADEIATADAASLYLGLKVGAEEPVAISATTAAETTVTVAGTAANYKTAWNGTANKYEYRPLTLAEYQEKVGDNTKTQEDYDGTWATSQFQLEGAVTTTKDIEDETTAPSIKVTWSWVDPDAEPAAPTYTDKTGAVVVNSGVFYVGTSSSAGFSDVTAEDVDSVTINGKSLTAEQLNIQSNATGTWIGVPAASITAVGEDHSWASGTTWEFVVIIGTDRYTASYTQG